MIAFAHQKDFTSWGRIIRAPHSVARPLFSDELKPLIEEARADVLAVGLQRSYGDSCLNANGNVIRMTGLDRLISFDPHSGLLMAEAGLSIRDLLAFAIPRGFFLPVTPGTRYVTLGGAVANDVHGKNQYRAGTIGRFVTQLTLLRTDGAIVTLTPFDTTGLFAATIGGLGLTGIILTVQIQLRSITSSDIAAEDIPFAHLDEFFRISESSEQDYEYTVAWVDCLASGDALGRGIFTRGNHAADGPLTASEPSGLFRIPMDLPSAILNRWSVKAFNQLYHAVGRRKSRARRLSYLPFFYPLDAIADWNRLYGKRGMYQYQCVVPQASARDAIAEILRQVAKAGEGSFLAVLKTFGSLRSPGLMSFPKEGTTLALDFSNREQETLTLMTRLDAVVREAKGRLYPAKDGRMPHDLFEDGYPDLEAFRTYVDPGTSSSFWRRINDEKR